MAGPISNNELQKLLGTRLELYRLAVENGFYNEWPETIPYRGFHIVRDEDGFFKVIRHGMYLITVKQIHVAKVWITCRLDNCGLMVAHSKVKSGQ